MRGFGRAFVVLALALAAPAAAYAQAAITGTAKDSSGAVLPGVTVEAASDVLIEKARTAITDGNGRFQLVDLRPGAYVVSFSLPGFNTVRRDGITLSGSATVAVDAEMRVGAVEETVTVTGEAPIIDTRSTTRQQVLSADLIDALPTTRNYLELARNIPGTVGGGNNVGGSQIQDVGGSVTVHGSRATDQRVTLNGVSTMTLQAGGGIGGQIPDVGSAGEIAVDTSSLGADMASGGVRINFIPRDGGNQFKGSTFFTFSNTSLQGSNYTPELKAAGLAAPNAIKKNFDFNQSFGGPIRKDRLWFWFSGRYNGADTFAPVFHNKNAFDPTKWTYEADPSRQAVTEGRVVQSSVRVTWQVSPRNKIAGTYKVDKWCNCPDAINATTPPEAGYDRRFPRLRQEHLEWTSPVNNHLLLEAVGLHLFERWGNMHLRAGGGGSLDSPEEQAALVGMIPVTEQSNGMTYRSRADFNNTSVPNYSYRVGASYITGSHAVKVGFNQTHGELITENYTLSPLRYTFNNGVPTQFTISARPFTTKANQDNDLGLYVQDKWTIDRLTLSGALRYDYFATSFPEQTLGPSVYTPTRNAVLPAEDNLAYKDITFRSGATYDLFGNGKTAVKAAFNKYLAGQTLNGLATSVNPINRLVQTASRFWDDANGNKVVDCSILNFAAQNLAASGGDNCGAVSGAGVNFGSVTAQTDFFDPDVLGGWGHRVYNYEMTVGVQHELIRRVSLDVGWFRRIWGNFQVTDNQAIGPADFDFFSMTVPVDSRLPDSGGYVLEGLRNLKPASFGRPTQNFTTLSDKIVDGGQTERGDYFDVGINGRLSGGLAFQVGVSTGKTTEDECALVEALPELNSGLPGPLGPTSLRPTQFCHRETPWVTQLKGYGVYTVPKIDVQVSGSFRSTKETSINANFTATNAYLAANGTLGRLLAGTTAPTQNISVALLAPNTMYLDRRNEVDLRFGKVLTFKRHRAVVSVDLFNAFNTNALLSVNQTYATWLAPTSILNPRLMKFSVQYDF
jgi:hypothetical protein